MGEAIFLSTLSLRRATSATIARPYVIGDFYPRSPCGERPSMGVMIHDIRDFYPRSPCGERPISYDQKQRLLHFYPRSPCGERLIASFTVLQSSEFLSTLSLRRATKYCRFAACNMVISIHALLAESDPTGTVSTAEASGFLSTLSLRRAT